MDLNALLERINCDREPAADEASLRALHRAFVTAVPFENLDIHLGRPIVLDEAAFFEKIVTLRRGGFCYELNGLFAAMLRQIGFNVTLLSAQVFAPDGQPGREFAHLLLLITLDERWIADVGFGDWSADPLMLDSAAPHASDGTQFRITPSGDRHVSERKDAGNEHWMSRYMFSLAPRKLTDFTDMCRFQQTHPESPFRRRRICTRRTPTGRVTLTEEKLISPSNGSRTETPIDSPRAYEHTLQKHFGITLPHPRRWVAT